MTKSNRSSTKPASKDTQGQRKVASNQVAGRFKGRSIDSKAALKDLDTRFEKARKFGEQLRGQRVVRQSFLDREVSI